MTEIIKMMKNIKRLFICHAFLFCSLIFAEWDGISISEPSTTIIDDVQYYEIDSPEELAWFAQQVNSQDTRINAILKADINLNKQYWRPIGDSTKTGFDGIFDGNGYRIAGLNVSNQKYAGLFGVLDSGTIKNLSINNSTIHVTDDGYAGGFAGITNLYSKIENVTNKAEITSDSTIKSIKRVGGIAGSCEGFMRDVQNEANITIVQSNGYIGGICGTIASNNLYPDSNLVNTGNIFGGRGTGGITGSGNYLKNLHNSGTVSGFYQIGGICGNCIFIHNSKNSGRIQNISPFNIGTKEIFVGGICGSCSQISKSENYGDMEIYSDLTVYAGGISGLITYDIYFGANYGNLSISSTNGTAYLGGILGKDYSSTKSIENVYNRGSLHSTHFAAGISTFLTTGDSLKNFFVAADIIDAPNAAGFVNYNGDSSKISKGFLDSTLLPNIPLIEENIGIAEKIYKKTTNQLQHDSIAHVLDISDRSQINEAFYAYFTTHWSRGSKYPIFDDSLHNPIYKVLFVNKDDSTFLYTDSSSHIKNAPITDEATWYSWSSYYSMSDMRIIDNNSVFLWSDSLIIATYPYCSDNTISDIGCCMGYFLDLYNKWKNECNGNGGEIYYAYKAYCTDSDSNGTMDGLDSTSYLYNTVQLHINRLQACNNSATSSSSLDGIYSSSSTQQSSAYESSSSTSHSSALGSSSSENSSTSSEFFSSSSKSNDITIIDNTILPPSYEMSINGKQIQIYGLERETPYALFDMQGRILRRGTALSTKAKINVSSNGSYIIKIKNHIRLVKIK